MPMSKNITKFNCSLPSEVSSNQFIVIYYSVQSPKRNLILVVNFQMFAPENRKQSFKFDDKNLFHIKQDHNLSSYYQTIKKQQSRLTKFEGLSDGLKHRSLCPFVLHLLFLYLNFSCFSLGDKRKVITLNQPNRSSQDPSFCTEAKFCCYINIATQKKKRKG